METENHISLRLRFYKDLEETIPEILEKFEKNKKSRPESVLVKIIDNHIWMHIIGEKRNYYSPVLHLELEEKETNKTHIRGLFGPNPTLWTLFMFLHFVVAGIFIGFAMFAYSNYMLKQPILLDCVVMFLMVVVWFLLYIIARQVRENGYPQMDELDNFLDEILK